MPASRAMTPRRSGPGRCGVRAGSGNRPGRTPRRPCLASHCGAPRPVHSPCPAARGSADSFAGSRTAALRAIAPAALLDQPAPRVANGSLKLLLELPVHTGQTLDVPAHLLHHGHGLDPNAHTPAGAAGPGRAPPAPAPSSPCRATTAKDAALCGPERSSQRPASTTRAPSSRTRPERTIRSASRTPRSRSARGARCPRCSGGSDARTSGGSVCRGRPAPSSREQARHRRPAPETPPGPDVPAERHAASAHPRWTRSVPLRCGCTRRSPAPRGGRARPRPPTAGKVGSVPRLALRLQEAVRASTAAVIAAR